MTPTPEQVAAFADGQLTGIDADEVARAVEGSPELKAQVAAHQALRARLSAHFGALIDEPANPQHLRLLQESSNVVDFAAAKAKRRRWIWIAAPALAASIAAAILIRPATPQQGYASPELATMLDQRLATQQGGNEPSRILLSFRAHDGRYCRAFAAPDRNGIACRDDLGWKLEHMGQGEGPASEYRQAASPAEIMQFVQEMADGPALDAAGETRARADGWQSRR
ncbi:hypothetical protein [Novosphingobium olei]|uniref:hypothetical protein n=1 Tax=Novosphingobium olei TaxID=2728851 RepID=UPI0030938EA5|nr:anti-sigma factor [Novosphingobium olei]